MSNNIDKKRKADLDIFESERFDYLRERELEKEQAEEGLDNGEEIDAENM